MRLIICLLMLALSSAALAGNADEYRQLGFARDGRVFVFEVFGIFDGSGGGHSTHYFLDTVEDRWLPGTPIRHEVREGAPDIDNVTLAQIRRDGAAKAAARLDALGDITPGRPLARQSLGQIGVDPYRLRWREPYDGSLPRLREPAHDLSIRTFALPGADFCPEPTKGFALALDGVEIHRDTSLPTSRVCPLDYHLAEVIENVAIVAVYGTGFEGWNRSFIALPLPTARR